MFLFLCYGCPDVQLIIFCKIAPMAILLTATCIEFVTLNLPPCFRYLPGNHYFIFRGDEKFLFYISSFIIRLDKIKLRTDYLPVPLTAVYKKFVKNGLSPVIAAQGLLVIRPLDFLDGVIRIAGFIIDDIHLFAFKFKFIKHALC